MTDQETLPEDASPSHVRQFVAQFFPEEEMRLEVTREDFQDLWTALKRPLITNNALGGGHPFLFVNRVLHMHWRHHDTKYVVFCATHRRSPFGTRTFREYIEHRLGRPFASIEGRLA